MAHRGTTQTALCRPMLMILHLHMQAYTDDLTSLYWASLFDFQPTAVIPFVELRRIYRKRDTQSSHVNTLPAVPYGIHIGPTYPDCAVLYCI